MTQQKVCTTNTEIRLKKRWILTKISVMVVHTFC